ncbi:MAG: DUF4295 domain-containing protein [candidate division Zixibacteria bacterium]|jgi:hypothetical protein|nr:DUF4295 domain-containing protein [candidate division Zixibacteria bacterium]
MAKKQTFQDKLKQKEARKEYLKVVKAVKTESGSWKFATKMVPITDENRNSVYK